MKKKNQIWAVVLLLTAVFFASPAKAQVTIGSQATPDKNAVLDLQSGGNGKVGLLLPIVTLTQTTNVAPMTAPVLKGMMVYNTATANDVVPGIYYYDGTKWVSISAGATGGSARYKVKSVTDPTYIISTADEDYVILTPNGNVTFTFPALTSAETGLKVMIFNYNTGGNGNTYNGPVNAATAGSGNGGIYVWTGTYWIALSKA